MVPHSLSTRVVKPEERRAFCERAPVPGGAAFPTQHFQVPACSLSLPLSIPGTGRRRSNTWSSWVQLSPGRAQPGPARPFGAGICKILEICENIAPLQAVMQICKWLWGSALPTGGWQGKRQPPPQGFRVQQRVMESVRSSPSL